MHEEVCPKCFVIMPFGEKTDIDGRLINFDVIYRYIIKAAIEELGAEDEKKRLQCIRSDDIERAGLIHEEMFESIVEADVAVVDITTFNANVFYEMGIRHATVPYVTVLIRRKDASIPFNIQGLRVIDYDPSNVDSFDTTKETIKRYVRNGLNRHRTDSPVRLALPGLRVNTGRAPLATGSYLWQMVDKETKIGVLTGDVRQLHGVDVWVNSENTHMRMARPHDPSLSGIINYLGAKRSSNGEVEEETIAIELCDKKGNRTTVDAGEVLFTSAGRLADAPFNVKFVFHAAAVHGVPGYGYQRVPNFKNCVSGALQLPTRHPDNEELQKVTSILLPLFGAGEGGHDLDTSARTVITHAVDCLKLAKDTQWKYVYFLAYQGRELRACQDVLNALPGLEPVNPDSAEPE